MRYQTEIHVAADRYVCIQLPGFIPEGRATVVVTVQPGPSRVEDGVDRDDGDGDGPEGEDVEWWDDLDDDRQGRG